MLFSNIILLVHIPLERREYIPLFHEIVTRPALNTQQTIISNPILVSRRAAVLRRYGKIFQLFPQHDDCLLRKQWIL